jgi:peptide/nickel transport system permease protein
MTNRLTGPTFLASARRGHVTDARNNQLDLAPPEGDATDDLSVSVAPQDRVVKANNGPLAVALMRLRRDKGAMIGAGFIVFMVLVAICAPLLTKLNGHPPNNGYSSTLDDNLGGKPLGAYGGLNSSFWFGVEPGTGRDLFSRIVYGARISLGISLSATFLTLLLGSVLGAAAGFFPGWIDMVISRIMDYLLSFPSLLFTISLIGIVPTSFPRYILIPLVLSGLGWPYIGRLVRTLVLSLREREFVEAARISGATERRILFKEILPNLTGPLLTYGSLIIPGYILAEAALSFLGLGIPQPTASWGAMLSDAIVWYRVDPTYLAVPGLALFLTVYAFNLFGDGVSSAFNPKSRT